METTYPPGPASVPANLTKPSPAYKRNAWLAVAGLAVFVVFYFLLAGWFLRTTYRLMSAAFSGGSNAFWGIVVGICSAFLSLFMIKALFFVKHGGKSDDIEITAQHEPRLFEFLHRLADEAGSPRPHRVFLSPSVNAAVFYDLSILNLLYPSKKNLLIGLGLVNVLNLGELKAVFAHEFGHFTQRSMALGRWVYIAQQIAAHIVTKRDALDSFLRGMSDMDIRLAWVGWLLSLIVWSIRSLVETFFQLVVLAQRALSREMEMQADLVAVSLTGSDALVHALHLLQAADDAWERTVHFAFDALADKRAVQDLFAIQTRIIGHIGAIRNDPSYGKVPPLPAQQCEQHRLFKADFAQPPRMWSTHPFNHEREDNAKRMYVQVPVDNRSAWDLFENPQQLREQISALVLGKAEAAPMSTEDGLREVDRKFELEAYKRCYRGAYLGRSIARGVRHSADMYAPKRAASVAELDGLYPESLAADLDQLRNLEQEKAMLAALHTGVLTAPNGVIRHRGRVLDARALPHEIELLSGEIAAINSKVNEHDRICRTVHRAVAASLGRGWEAHLVGLAQILHYAEHSAANLNDVRGFLGNTISVVTSVRRVSAKGVRRVVGAAEDVFQSLREIYDQSAQVKLNTGMAQKLGAETWKDSLGEFTLPEPLHENINEWIKAIDSWVNATLSLLYTLRQESLEQLLRAEAEVASAFREGSSIEPAPAPAQVPARYMTLLPGSERERQTTLGWWARFQNADGIGPAIARLAVALSIVGAVLGLGSSVGSSVVCIYNGLARPVEVNFGDKRLGITAFSSDSVEVAPKKHYTVRTITGDGKSIESFDAFPEAGFVKYVYNIAGASPLVEWTAVYGAAASRPPRLLGAPRWISTSADILFKEPPTYVNTKGSGASRDVLSGFGEKSPDIQLGNARDEGQLSALISAHARWDMSNSRYIMYWLAAASRAKGFDAILEGRLKDNPNEVVALRFEQDYARYDTSPVADAAYRQICQRHREMAAAAPANGDLQYIAIRCISDDAQRDQAFIDARAKWPRNGWLAFAAGFTLAEQERWQDALTSLETARCSDAAISSIAVVDIARIRRMLSPADPHTLNLADIAAETEQLRFLTALETGKGIKDGPMMAYVALASGQIRRALQLAKGTEAEPRVLRLAAASDGADAKLAEQALALPHDKGMDVSSLCATIGLAAREKADLSPYAPMLREKMRAEEAQAVLRFIEILSAGRADAAEQSLGRILPEARGYAYSTGLIVLGNNSPADWRHHAKRLLFSSERPYFD